MDIKHFDKTVVGLVRKANEDFIGNLTNQQTNGYGDVFIVCDGMGGHVGGAKASQTAVECIKQYFENNPHVNPILALEKAISFANQQIYAISQNNPDLSGMGTTCTVLLRKGDNFYIAHVGDSRIYISTDKKLYRITKDHSFVQKLVDAGQLKNSEMESHPRKNELTRALGISNNVEVEVSENPIISKKGDKFLMCSDGLCGLVNDLTISYILNKNSSEEAVNELISAAENAGGNDNISVDIIEVINSPHSKTVFNDQSNKSEDLSATQSIDLSIKNDNLISNLKKYKYYFFSIILIFFIALIYILMTPSTVITEPPSTDITPITKPDTINTPNITIKVIKEQPPNVEEPTITEEQPINEELPAEEEPIEEERDEENIDKTIKLYNEFKKQLASLENRIKPYDNDYTKDYLDKIKNRKIDLDDNQGDLTYLQKFDSNTIEEDVTKLISKIDSILKPLKKKTAALIEKFNNSNPLIKKNFINEFEGLKLLNTSKSSKEIEIANKNFATNFDISVNFYNAKEKELKEKDEVIEIERYKWDKKEPLLGKVIEDNIGNQYGYQYSKADQLLNEKYKKEIKSVNERIKQSPVYREAKDKKSIPKNVEREFYFTPQRIISSKSINKGERWSKEELYKLKEQSKGEVKEKFFFRIKPD